MSVGKKQHIGLRLPPVLVAALDSAAAANDITRTALMQKWLSDRGVAEGWLEPQLEGTQ